MARERQGRIARLTQRLANNGEAILALLVAVAVGVLAVLDVLGTERVNAAILLVLALLAATLLRDRQSAKALARQGTAVQQLDWYAARKQLLDACDRTFSWEFRGGTGEVLRSTTLPRCIAARTDTFRLRCEILDPTDVAVCEAYAKHRARLAGSGREKERWTAAHVQDELLATVFAVCWYRQQHRAPDFRVGLSSVLNTICWDRSDGWLIVSEEGKNGYALVVDHDKPYYGAFSSDMTTSFERTRRLAVDAAGQPTLPPRLQGAEIRAVFAAVGLDLVPAEFTDRRLVEIARTALRKEETAMSALRARTVDRGVDDPRLTVRR